MKVRCKEMKTLQSACVAPGEFFEFFNDIYMTCVNDNNKLFWVRIRDGSLFNDHKCKVETVELVEYNKVNKELIFEKINEDKQQDEPK